MTEIVDSVTLHLVGVGGEGCEDENAHDFERIYQI